jgi:ATP-binding cassette subfamily B protein/ATP-binding cassette subfamily B multidrug efflux pump
MKRFLSWFEARIPAFPDEMPTQPPQTVFQFCRYYVRGAESYLFALAFTTALLAISEAGLYAILGQVVDWLATQDSEGFFQREKFTLSLFAAFILVFLPLLVCVQSALVNQSFMGNLPMRTRWLGHRYLLKQSWGFYQYEFSGRIATKLMQTALGVRECILKVTNVLMFISVYLISILILVASLDWRLSLPLLAWLIGYTAILKFFLPRLRLIAMDQADSRSEMTGRIVDSYTNIQTLKLYSNFSSDQHYAKASMQSFLATVHPQMRLVTGLNVSVWLLNMAVVFTISALSLWLWTNNSLSTGAVAVAMSVSIRITGMSHWIMWEVSNLFENIGVVNDGVNTLSKSLSVTDKVDAKDLVLEQAAIDFNNIDFAYGENVSVFKQLTLKIKPGEKIGLIGRSGAGKSTLVNLLLRFYDLDSGQITIDQQPIEQLKQDSLRANIAMVSQDTSLLHRSVRDNIAIGNPQASEQQIRAAAAAAKADTFIASLEDDVGRTGFDAHVGERGVTLSGGQRQRIAIARALLKDAPIVILDEATSALDSEVEAEIQQSFAIMMQNKTVIAIAHRLSTIAAMDRLIVLDQGHIVEQGSHQQLLAKGGVYAELWQQQVGGFMAN